MSADLAARSDRARANFDALLAYKREGERRGIPAVIREIWAGRQWLDLGHQSYGAACEAILGPEWRNPWPVDDRREVVAELDREGMSTRAIASAVGVNHATVVRDIQAGGADAPPDDRPATKTGLDGKTYSATQPARVTTTTRTTEATKVERAVDLDTGEIVEDATPRGPLIDDLIANDAQVRAANLRHELSKYIAYNAGPWPDPQEMARIAPDMAEGVARMAERVQRFATAYESALPKPGTGLHVVKEA